MRLTINLASEDYRKTKLIKILLWVFSILLIGAGAWQVQTYLAYQGEDRDLKESHLKVEESQRNLEKELRNQGMDTSEAGVSAFTTKISILNELIVYKAFSWTLFLNELESAVPDNIAVTRLQPKLPEGMITLTGKAISLKDLTKLVIRLEDSQAFGEVFLKDQTTDKEGFVEFTVEFKYRLQNPDTQS
jgi:type IV pilus assembly protein PilN